MKKMALCTAIPEKRLKEIAEYCDIKLCGELKHGKGNVTEEELLAECEGAELIVLGDEKATAKCIEAWAAAGMKFIGCAKGTPVTVDHEALSKTGVKLSYTPGRNAVAVSEFTIGLILAATRKIAVGHAGLKTGEHLGAEKENVYDVDDKKNVIWGPLDETHPIIDYGIGFEMHGHTLGIVGYGAIGIKTAKLAQAFGMKVVSYDPYCPEEKMLKDGVEPVTLDCLLTSSDVVSIHLPVNPGTTGIVDESWFGRMKPTAFFVNTARAAVINQKALVDALEQKKIGGAALDVFWEEPIPANHPLLKMRNVVLTPHLAGLTTDVDNWSGEIIAQDILAWLKGKERQYIWKR